MLRSKASTVFASVPNTNACFLGAVNVQMDRDFRKEQLRTLVVSRGAVFGGWGERGGGGLGPLAQNFDEVSTISFLTLLLHVLIFLKAFYWWVKQQSSTPQVTAETLAILALNVYTFMNHDTSPGQMPAACNTRPLGTALTLHVAPEEALLPQFSASSDRRCAPASRHSKPGGLRHAGRC